MANGRGKEFEQVFREALDNPTISLDRFPDPMAGYKGIRNICDFGVYRYPLKFYFECKAYSGNTLNFGSSITKDQWEGLERRSTIFGVIAGVVVWFTDHDVTAFVPIQELARLKAEGKKSLHVDHIRKGEVDFIFVPGRKKRVFFEYNGKEFLNALESWYLTLSAEVLLNGERK